MKPHDLEAATAGIQHGTDTIIAGGAGHRTAIAATFHVIPETTETKVEDTIKQTCVRLWRHKELFEEVVADMTGADRDHVEERLAKVIEIFFIQLRAQSQKFDEEKVSKFLRTLYLLEAFSSNHLEVTINEAHPALAASDFAHVFIETNAHDPDTGVLLPTATLAAHFTGDNLQATYGRLSKKEQLTIKACTEITNLTAQSCKLTGEDVSRFLTIARQIRDEEFLINNKN